MEAETQTTPVQATPHISDREMLEEIYKNSKKTKNYMKWQLIITVAFVVIPLIATLILIPVALNSFSSIFSAYGIDNLTGGTENIESGQLQNLIDQYTK